MLALLQPFAYVYHPRAFDYAHHPHWRAVHVPYYLRERDRDRVRERARARERARDRARERAREIYEESRGGKTDTTIPKKKQILP